MYTCQFTRFNGERCKTHPIKGDAYCFFHSEKMKEKRKDAVKKGGNSLKRSYGRDDYIALSNVDDVFKLLEQTANDLRQNKINNKTAAILNFIAGTTLKAVDAKYIESGRIKASRKTKDLIAFEKLMYEDDE